MSPIVYYDRFKQIILFTVIFILVIPASLLAWNVIYVEADSILPGTDTRWAKICGHNWIFNQAYEFCKRYGLAPEGLSENGVHYGLLFADDPWIGRPESFNSQNIRGAHYRTPNEELNGKTVDVDHSQMLGGTGGTNWIEVKFKGQGYSKSKPNLYLEARQTKYIAGLSEVMRLLDNGEIILPFMGTSCDAELRAADNYFHFSNKDVSGGHEKLQLDGTLNFYNNLFEYQSNTWTGGRVSANQYGAELFGLAQRFYKGKGEDWAWKDNQYRPNLLDLTPIPMAGRLVLQGDEMSTAHAYFPPTFLGGNPFILSKEGYATWPIWVPDEFSTDKLEQLEAEYSNRAASIYLGWGLHMLMDLAQPYHAVNKTGQHHAKYEDWADSYIQLLEFNSIPVMNPSYPVINGTSIQWPVYDHQFWRDIIFAKIQNGSLKKGDFPDWDFRTAADRIAKEAGARYDFVHAKHKGKNDATAVYTTLYLFDMAVKECIRAIATFERQDKNEKPYETFEVAIKTSNAEGSGTQANPHIILIGDKDDRYYYGSKDKILLWWNQLSFKGPYYPNRLDNFEAGEIYYRTPKSQLRIGRRKEIKQGSVTKYLVREKEVGELKGIMLAHDNKGPSPGWTIEKISVKRLSDSSVWAQNNQINLSRGSTSCIYPTDGRERQWPKDIMEDNAIVFGHYGVFRQTPYSIQPTDKPGEAPAISGIWFEKKEGGIETVIDFVPCGGWQVSLEISHMKGAAEFELYQRTFNGKAFYRVIELLPVQLGDSIKITVSNEYLQTEIVMPVIETHHRNALRENLSAGALLYFKPDYSSGMSGKGTNDHPFSRLTYPTTHNTPGNDGSHFVLHGGYYPEKNLRISRKCTLRSFSPQDIAIIGKGR